jgi:hypothetical protein
MHEGFIFYFWCFNATFRNMPLGGHCGRDRMVIGFIQLPMQSVPITNNVVSSNLVHG